MRSGGVLVHQSFSLWSVLVPDLQTLVNVFIVLGHEHMSALDIDPRIWTLLDHQFVGVLSIPQQVLNLFLVNLNEATSHQVSLAWLILRVNHLENMLECSRHDASLNLIVRVANHSVSLTTACLTIRKDSSLQVRRWAYSCNQWWQLQLGWRQHDRRLEIKLNSDPKLCQTETPCSPLWALWHWFGYSRILIW